MFKQHFQNILKQHAISLLLLVQCPCGYAGNDCSVCPFDTYSDTPGQTTCTMCKRGFKTVRKGSTSSTQCIPKRKYILLKLNYPRSSRGSNLIWQSANPKRLIKS